MRVVREMPGCLGARMMGAGFGGSVLALVAKDAAHPIRQAVLRTFHRRSGAEPDIYLCHASDGASIEMV